VTERHKPSPRTSTKRYSCDQCQAFRPWHWNSFSVRRIVMYITWSIKTSQVALYTVELQNTQHRRNVRAVLTVGILWRISERVVTKLITSHRWFSSALFLSLDHAGRTYCSLGSIEYNPNYWASGFFKFWKKYFCIYFWITESEHRCGYYSGDLWNTLQWATWIQLTYQSWYL